MNHQNKIINLSIINNDKKNKLYYFNNVIIDLAN